MKPFLTLLFCFAVSGIFAQIQPVWWYLTNGAILKTSVDKHEASVGDAQTWGTGLGQGVNDGALCKYVANKVLNQYGELLLEPEIQDGRYHYFFPLPNNSKLFGLFIADVHTAKANLYVIDPYANGGHGEVVLKNTSISLGTGPVDNYEVTISDDCKSFWVLADVQGSFTAYRISYAGEVLGSVKSALNSTNFRDSDRSDFSSQGNYFTRISALYFELCTFDKTTGLVTKIDTHEFTEFDIAINSAELSPDGTKLYIYGLKEENKRSRAMLFQIPVVNGEVQWGLARDVLDVHIHSASTLQLGIDGKIYIFTHAPITFAGQVKGLSVIHKPNEADCEFEWLGVNYNIPVFGAYFPLMFPSQYSVDQCDLNIQVKGSCAGTPIGFVIDGFEGEGTCLWDFGDGYSNTEISPNHIFNRAGTYQVKVDIIYTSNSTKTLTKEITIYPTPTTLAIQYEP